MFKRALATLALFAFACTQAVADQRVTWYYGEQANSNTLNTQERAHRLAVGQTLLTLFGPNGGYNGLTITPTTGLYVAVGPTATNINGVVYQIGADDLSAWGGGVLGPTTALPADPTEVLLQALISQNVAPIGPLAVPTTSGQSEIALIECQVLPADTTPTTNTFITALGAVTQETVNRDRIDTIACQQKAGVAAITPAIPAVDAGYVAIGFVTVPYGTSTLTSANVSMLSTIQPSVTHFALAPTSTAQVNQYGLNVPILVNGTDESTYSFPASEIAGEYNPAIQSTIVQGNTGIPTAGYFQVTSSYGSNSSSTTVDSTISPLFAIGNLGSGSNNSLVSGLNVQSQDTSAATGHATTKGDAYQITVNAGAYNNSNDPSNSTLGFCGTADCLQGSYRTNVLSFNHGTYPLSSAFRSEFSSTAGNAASAGNRPYAGYISDDAINADFVACDPTSLSTRFSAHCVATYGFLANPNGVATGSRNWTSSALGFRSAVYNGTTSAYQAWTLDLEPLSNASNAHNELRHKFNGSQVGGLFDDGELEIDALNTTPFLSSAAATSTVINMDTASQNETDLYNIDTDATTTDRAFSWRSYNGGTDSELASLTRAGVFSATQFSGSGAGLTAIPDSALVTAPLTGLTCSANVTCGTGTTPTVQVTGAPSFTAVTGGNVTDSALTSGDCVQASTAGLLSNAAAQCVTSLTAGSNITVTTGASPTVAVTAAPSFSGKLTVTSSSGIYASSGPVGTAGNAASASGLFTFGQSAGDLIATNATGGNGEFDFYNSATSGTYTNAFEFWQSNGTTAVALANITSTPLCFDIGSSSYCATTSSVNGTLKSASVASGTLGYVAPVYTNGGVATASTVHWATGSCTFSASTTCAVSLTGTSTGQFGAAPYPCFFGDTSASPPTYSAKSETTSGFTISASASTSDSVAYACGPFP